MRNNTGRLDKIERALTRLGLKQCESCGEFDTDVKLCTFKKSDGYIFLCLHCRHDKQLSGEII
jgi:hypothetical protein